MLRLNGIMGEAYSYLQWAMEFIDLADEHWGVTKNHTFEKHGSSFMPSIRRGVMVAMLQTFITIGSPQRVIKHQVEISDYPRKFPEIRVSNYSVKIIV